MYTVILETHKSVRSTAKEPDVHGLSIPDLSRVASDVNNEQSTPHILLTLQINNMNSAQV